MVVSNLQKEIRVFTMEQIFTHDRKIRITQRYHVISTSLGVSLFFTVIFGVIIFNQKVDAQIPNIFIVLIIFVVLALLLLIGLPINWNMIVISSSGIKFTTLKGSTNFKWSEIQSFTLTYRSKAVGDKRNKGRARSFAVKVTSVEGKHHRLQIRYIPKFRFAFRVEAEEKIVTAFVDQIVDSIAFAPSEELGPSKFDSDYQYTWEIHPKKEQNYSHF